MTFDDLDCGFDEPLSPGEIFSTKFETGCVVLTTPDDCGEFLARDSDDVVCSYHIDMVIEVTG